MHRFSSALAFLALLSACGGGGGGSQPQPDPPAPPPPVGNRPPTLTSPSTASVAENTTGTVYTAAATDADNNPVSFSITGGADAARFQLTAAGALTFVNSPDFEIPEDNDRNNVYEVQITASDGAATAAMQLAVTVTNAGQDRVALKRSNHSLAAVSLTPVPDGTGRMFAADFFGSVSILDPVSGSNSHFTSVNDMGHIHWTSGLRGFAVAPDFMTSGVFYLTMTNRDGDMELRRYRTEAGNRFAGDRSTADLILKIPFGTSADYIARGGWIGFGADGNLYLAVGDGSMMDAVSPEAQNINSRRGKILRIGVNGDDFPADPARDYTIPAGNPFPGGGAPEVWALGIRDPRVTYDAPTQTLWIGDTNRARQEINLMRIQDGGTNFGWPFRDGTTTLSDSGGATLVPPVLEWATGTGPREEHFAVSGHIYRGGIERFQGRYIFGTVGGKIWSVRTRDIQVGSTISSDRFIDITADIWGTTPRSIYSFGLDQQNDLYIGSSPHTFWIEPEAL